MARRALDYLVGFNISPILWTKLPGSKSAGRVQSVALRLLTEREHEIEIFKPSEYWTLNAFFKTKDSSDPFVGVVWVRLPDKPLIQLVSCGQVAQCATKVRLVQDQRCRRNASKMISEAKPGQSVQLDCFDRPLMRGDEIVGKTVGSTINRLVMNKWL